MSPHDSKAAIPDPAGTHQYQNAGSKGSRASRGSDPGEDRAELGEHFERA